MSPYRKAWAAWLWGGRLMPPDGQDEPQWPNLPEEYLEGYDGHMVPSFAPGAVSWIALCGVDCEADGFSTGPHGPPGVTCEACLAVVGVVCVPGGGSSTPACTQNLFKPGARNP